MAPAASALPTRSSDSLMDKPASYRFGVFPQDLLLPNERLLFETRPSLVGLYWGRLLLFGFFDLIWLSAGIGLVTNGAAWFLFGVFTLVIVYYLLVWRSTAYALTDRRVLSVGGVRRQVFAEAVYSQVQNIRYEPGAFGGIKFDAATPVGADGRPKVRRETQFVHWTALLDSARVYEFVQRAFSVQSAQSSAQARLLQAVQQETAASIPCQYCGAMIDLRTVSGPSPKCPSCGAPLTLVGVNAGVAQMPPPAGSRPPPSG